MKKLLVFSIFCFTFSMLNPVQAQNEKKEKSSTEKRKSASEMRAETIKIPRNG